MHPYEDAHDHAAEARVVLSSPALIRAFEGLERAYHAAWRGTPSTDAATLQAIRGRQECLDALKADLELMLNAGKIADFNTKLRRTK